MGTSDLQPSMIGLKYLTLGGPIFNKEMMRQYLYPVNTGLMYFIVYWTQFEFVVFLLFYTFSFSYSNKNR